MNKYLALTMAILNTILLILYFTNTSRVETYQWIITPMFIIFFTSGYLEQRKNKG